jgi:hypothetical protein
MSDEKPVPETLDTISAKIAALGKSIDARFAQVDAHFAQVDARFDKVTTELRVEIEAVNENVNRVYDAVIAQREKNEANVAEHERLGKRLENHEVRILALERDTRNTG